MAGSRRIATALARAGVWAASFELADAPAQDVLAPRNVLWLRDLCQPGRCQCIWIGIVRASWSAARRHVSGKRGFPPPLRGKGDLIWGCRAFP